MTGGQQLNPDSEGRSLPTSLKILQLKSAEKLEAAEFEQVYGREKEALGDALLRVDELTLSPGESVRKALPREPGARAVAAVALFRKPTGTHWRVIASIPPGRAPPLELGLAEYHIWFASALRTRGENR